MSERSKRVCYRRKVARQEAPGEGNERVCCVSEGNERVCQREMRGCVRGKREGHERVCGDDSEWLWLGGARERGRKEYITNE